MLMVKPFGVSYRKSQGTSDGVESGIVFQLDILFLKT